MVTSSGVPLLWPIPTGRRMWRMFGIPDAFAVRVGGTGEQLLRATFVVVSLLAALALFAPSLLDRVTPAL
jgi:membrane-bound metal-dependent hydrolase YbcI (DUF457 family)